MRLWHLFILLVLVQAAWKIPEAQAVVTAKLASLAVRINGVEKEIRFNEKLELIRGDELTLLHAVLKGTAQSPDTINFVGYRGEGLRRWQDDDRDILIPTSELKKGWSLDKSGKLYKVETKTGNKSHGDIFVTIVNPELKTLRLSIKGVEYDLQPGAVREMQADDPIKILDIKTNLKEVDKLVRVEFKEKPSGKDNMVELRIIYRSYAFASVFLRTDPNHP